MSALPACITTARLHLHRWPLAAAQTAAICAALPGILTPKATRSLPPSLALTEEPAGWLEARAKEADIYAIFAPAPDQPIGLLLLAWPDPKTCHIGYVLAEHIWGNGYATEMLAGLLRTLPHGVTLRAGVSAQNPASARVLKKAGFHALPPDGARDMLQFVYKDGA
jgi:ribosomal-protein-alanine N-acetyltransferase